MQSRGKVCKRPAGAFMNTPFTAWRRPHAQGREQEKAEGRPLFPSRRRRDWGCGGKAPAKQLNITKISVTHTLRADRADGGNAVSGRSAAKAAARAQLAISRRAFKSSEHHKNFGHAYARNRADGGNAVSGRGAGGGAAGAARDQPPGF